MEADRVYALLGADKPRFEVYDGDGRVVASTLIKRLAERMAKT